MFSRRVKLMAATNILLNDVGHALNKNLVSILMLLVLTWWIWLQFVQRAYGQLVSSWIVIVIVIVIVSGVNLRENIFKIT